MDRKIDPLDQSRGKVDLRPPTPEERAERAKDLARALAKIEHATTNRHYVAHYVDVAHLRKRMGMTQAQFARRFGFPVATLRHWEHGDRKPAGAALVLLNVIDRNPRAVLDALKPNHLLDY
jgi:putative transcriptional regulator